ncbi:MAG TPA: HDIG domain-containing protein, partial [Candidatus Kapabacteria bacterium]|nr:HDIG domain-containing protein [Candidatus Kapabacteria bacterium]
NNTISKYFGAVCYLLLLGILTAFYLFSLRKRLLADNQQLTIIVLILLFESALAFLSMRFGNIFPVEYLIVVPTAAMLCTILFDSRTGFFFAVVAALLVAGIRGGDYSFGLAALVAGGMAAFTVRDLRSRTQLFRSIGYIFLGYVITIASTALERSDPLSRVWQEIAFAGINAVVSPVFTYAILIVFERVFRLSSDLTLLEFDNINHPLLKELSTNAPGTFHHTMVIADMAERAANAIGANAILAKVGAYYHDIGKILKPDFFVENQLDKKNKHERLSPLNSAQIIAQHVLDGIRLGKEYKLPQKIIDFIPMHHGTSVIAYFYDRALRRRRREDVKIDDFRYPGPKPHSKETAIVMLADSVEATVRSSQTIDESAIESIVERTIRNRFLEGQLDECDLTAGDMKIIKDQFVEILIGIHHPRIKYPGQPNEEPDASVIVESFPTEPMPQETAPTPEQPISQEAEDTQPPTNDLPAHEDPI